MMILMFLTFDILKFGNVQPVFFSPASSAASIPAMFDPQMMMQQPQVIQQSWMNQQLPMMNQQLPMMTQQPQMMNQQPQMIQPTQMMNQQPQMTLQQPQMINQQPQMMVQQPMMMMQQNSGRQPSRNSMADSSGQQQFRVVYQPMLVRVGPDGTPWQMVDEGAPPDVVGDYRQEEVSNVYLQQLIKENLI